MRRLVWSLILTLAAAATATGGLHLAAGTATVAPGDTAALPLLLTESTVPSSGFNATIHLPPGMSLSGVVRGNLLPASDFRLLAHTLDVPSLNAVSLLASSASQTFSSTGTLCTLLIAIPSDTGPGDYPIVLDAPDRSPPVRGHAFASADGAVSLAHTVGNGLVSVRMPGLPGDFSRIGLNQSATPPLNVYTDHPPADSAAFFYRLIQLKD